MMEKNPPLRGYIQGYVTERVLERVLSEVPGVSKVTKIPDSSSQKGDFEVIFEGATITIESKSVRTTDLFFDQEGKEWHGKVKIAGSDTKDVRVGNKTFVTCCQPEGAYDILSICTFSADNTWSFIFTKNEDLPKNPDIPGYLKSSMQVSSSMRSTASIRETLLICKNRKVKPKSGSSNN